MRTGNLSSSADPRPTLRLPGANRSMKSKDEWRPTTIQFPVAYEDLMARRMPDEIEMRLMERNDEGEYRIAERWIYQRKK